MDDVPRAFTSFIYSPIFSRSRARPGLDFAKAALRTTPPIIAVNLIQVHLTSQ